MRNSHKFSLALIGLAACLALFVFHAPRADALGEAADAMCNPYFAQCPCNEVPNSQGKCVPGGQNSNTHGCPVGVCKDTTDGKLTEGICSAQNKCDATLTNGKAPVQAPTAPQSSQQNSSSATQPQLTSNTAPQQTTESSAGSSGGSSAGGEQVAGSRSLSAAPAPQPVETTQTPQPQVSSGNSVLQSAYEWLTGQNSSLPQYQGGEPNGPNTQQPVDQPTWLAGAQQAQLQLGDSAAPSLQSAPVDVSPGNIGPAETPGFAPTSGTQGSLVPSASDAAYANTLVTMSPAQQAVQAAQTVQQGIVDTAGSWAQSAMQYFDQGTAASQNIPQAAGPASDVQATIYTPGEGGAINGGLYGTHDNYLDPNIPTVAAGYGSGYQYGQVLNLTNPDTGQSINAVVGDVCPGCGKGIDLTPAAADPIGFTLEKGVTNLGVDVVATTPGYTEGAQLASNLNSQPDPWAAAPGSLPSLNQNTGVLGVATVNDYGNYALASTQYTTDQIAAASAANAQEVAAFDSNSGQPNPNSAINTGEAISQADANAIPPSPTGAVESTPLPLSDQQVATNIPVPQQEQGSLPTQAQAQAQLLQQGEQLTPLNANSFYQSVQGQQFAEPVPANPVAAIQQGPELAPPNPVGAVTSEPLSLTNQQIEAGVPVPEQVQTNPQQTIEATNQAQANFAAQVEASGLSDRLIQADAQTAAYQQALLNAPSNIPMPQMVEQSGEAITQQIAQATPQSPLPEVSSNPQFSMIGSIGSQNDAATNGTSPTTAQVFDQNSVALGASSYNPDVAQAVQQATQFTPNTSDQSQQLSGNVPLPESRPPEAGATGIDLSGCGGVCEQGNTGTDVKAIQSFLTSQGYNAGPLDGVYGPQTANAVQDFQQENHIAADGIVGPQTLGVMNTIAGSDISQSAQATTQASPSTGAADQQTAAVPAEQPATQAVNETIAAVPAEQAAKPEQTYTLSNAGDLRSQFLVNPVTAAAIPDSMKQDLVNAYNTGAASVTFTQSQLDSIRWDALPGSQAIQLQNLLGQVGYQTPYDISANQQPGVEQIAFLQANAVSASYVKQCWASGYCY